MGDHRKIYLAPPCCYSEGEGRQWCQDNVWPCNDCPDTTKAAPSVYRLDREASEIIAAELASEATEKEPMADVEMAED